MKNFSLKTKESYRHSSKKTGVLKAVIFSVSALLALFFISVALGKIAMVVVRPFYGISTYLRDSTAALPVYLRGRNELLSEINTLKEQLSAKSGDEGTIARLVAENEEYKNLLSIHTENRIGAGIIARPPHIPYDMLMLDRGGDDGIKEGAVVYQAFDHAIGFVSSVFNHSALVTLFSSPGIQTTVYIFGPNIFTTSYGEGGGIVRVSVPQGVTIAEGDVVILPSLASGLIGVVQTVHSVPTEPEQYGYIAEPIPMQSLHTVSVSTEVIKPATFEEARGYIDGARTDLFMVTIPTDESANTGLSGTSSASSSITKPDVP